MKYSGPTLVNNINELARLKNKKLGIIEENAGLSQGYLSRKKDKADSPAPPLEALLSIAEQLDTTIYYLLCHNSSELSTTEDETIAFAEKLANDTIAGKLSWKTELPGIFNKSGQNDFEPTHPLMEVGINYSDEFSTAYYNANYVSKFFDDLYFLDGESFNVELPGTNYSVYLMHISYIPDGCAGCINMNDSKPAIEMYFVSKDKKTVKPICCTHNLNENVAGKINELYSCIKGMNCNIGLDTEAKSAMTAFMNY